MSPQNNNHRQSIGRREKLFSINLTSKHFLLKFQEQVIAHSHHFHHLRQALRRFFSLITSSIRLRLKNELPKEGILAFFLMLIAVFVTFNFNFEIKEAIFSPLEVIILILIGLSLFWHRFRPFKERMSLRYLIPLVAFLIPAIVARFLIVKLTGSWAEIGWRVFRNLFELIPLILIVVVANLRQLKIAKKIILVLLLTSTLASVIGIIETFSNGRYLTGVGVHGNFRYLGLLCRLPSQLFPLAEMNLGRTSVITNLPDSNIFRAHGSLSSHNYFAAFLVMTLCLTLGLAFTEKRKRTFYSFLVLFQLGALILTFSRAALAGCLIGLGLLLLMTKINPRNLITILLLFLVIFTALKFTRPDLMSAFVERTMTFTALKDTQEVEARTKAWRLSTRGIAKKMPLGHGTGALEDFTLSGVPLSSHNDYLDVLYARGVVALLGWLAILFLAMKDSFSLFKEKTNSFSEGIGAGVFCGLAGLIVTGIGQPIIQAPDSAALIWLCIGVVVALMNIKKTQER